jgi:hypothetical protein
MNDPTASLRTRIRLVSLGALLITLAMTGNCSATGVSNARGIGAQLISRDPTAYLVTIAALTAPLVVLLALPLVLTIGRVGARRARAILIVIVVAGAGALVTSYVAFVASYSTLCAAGSPTAAQDAACAGGSGALAAVFGVAILGALPFAISLVRASRELGQNSAHSS